MEYEKPCILRLPYTYTYIFTIVLYIVFLLCIYFYRLFNIYTKAHLFNHRVMQEYSSGICLRARPRYYS